MNVIKLIIRTFKSYKISTVCLHNSEIPLSISSAAHREETFNEIRLTKRKLHHRQENSAKSPGAHCPSPRAAAAARSLRGCGAAGGKRRVAAPAAGGEKRRTRGRPSSASSGNFACLTSCLETGFPKPPVSTAYLKCGVGLYPPLGPARRKKK